MSTWILRLGGKIHIFLLEGPKLMWPSNCLKILPIAVFFFFSSDRARFVLPFRIPEASGQIANPHLEPIKSLMSSQDVTTVWHPELSDTLPQPESS